MSSEPRPDLLLITVECWRGDHFTPLLTPSIAKLGEQSTVFTDAHASGGWTLPSMTALMSSTYPSMHGGCRIALRTPERKPLAEVLLDAGYWTAGFSGNPTCGSGTGFHRGFADYADVRRSPPDLPDDIYPHRKDGRSLAELGISPGAVEHLAYAEQLTDMGLRWLEARQSDAPWFLWLHYSDPHWPYRTAERPFTQAELVELWEDRRIFRDEIHPSCGTLPDDKDAGPRWTARYREALQIADHEIGRLLDALQSRPDCHRTIVAITGDHGEEFQEHGVWQHQWNSLYREGTHVPLIVNVPGSRRKKVLQPVGLLDIAPTLLDYAGIDRPRSMLGTSLRPAIDGENFAPRPVFTEMMAYRNGTSYRLAIRDGDWKYIYDFDDRHRSLLFRISEDPAERKNLREHNPDSFRRFEEMRLKHVTLGLIRLLERQTAAERYENDDAAAREQLAALGYL